MFVKQSMRKINISNEMGMQISVAMVLLLLLLLIEFLHEIELN